VLDEHNQLEVVDQPIDPVEDNEQVEEDIDLDVRFLAEEDMSSVRHPVAAAVAAC
jgi:hypothetical protein